MTLADLFRSDPDPAAFRRAVAALGGDFPLGSADMAALGEAYFERCPDRAHDRNAAEVLLGYALVRAAVVEKAVLAVPPGRRAAYREMLEDVARVAPRVDSLLTSAGPGALLADHAALSAAVAAIKATIDELPKGPVKERWVGGISNLFNILYVLRTVLRARVPG